MPPRYASERLNVQHSAKIEEEKQYLQPLPKYRVADYEILTATVSCRSTIDLRCVLYTVPARLIGRQLELHLHHDRILGFLGNQQVAALPRIRVSDKDKRRTRCINYRHVAEGLRRKPRAFLYCTWQHDLLPNDTWCNLWQQLKAQFDLDSAAVLMVEALYSDATQDKEAAVADYLQAQLAATTLTLVGLRRYFQLFSNLNLPTLTIAQHDLTNYDQLLRSTAADHTVSEPQPSPQTAASVSYADPLGERRAASNARGMVIRSVFALLCAS